MSRLGPGKAYKKKETEKETEYVTEKETDAAEDTGTG